MMFPLEEEKQLTGTLSLQNILMGNGDKSKFQDHSIYFQWLHTPLGLLIQAYLNAAHITTTNAD